MRSVPSSAATRSASPWSPVPADSSAPPTPSSAISMTARPSRRETRTVVCVACAYLATLASASQATKYAASSTGSGRRSGALEGDRGRDARARGQRLERGLQPVVEHRGMDPARELAQLLQRLGELVAGRPDELLRQRRVGADAALDHPQLKGDGDEPLLRAVVEVALQPPPLRVAGGDDALARGAQLREPVLGLGLQPRVVERDRGRGGDGLDELGIVVERRVVDEHPELAAVALDRRRRTVATRRGRRRPAVRRRRCRSARPARDRRGRAVDRRASWRGPPPAARRAACRARGRDPRVPPRASRERSRPQSSAAGTVSSAVFRTQKSGITGESSEQRS